MYTHVILAQPRGSRLRADAVYVDRRRWVAMGGANARSWFFLRPFLARTPPESKSPKARQLKNPLKKPLKHANICQFLPPKCWYAFHKGEFILITIKIRRWHAFRSCAHIHYFSSWFLDTFSDFWTLFLIFGHFFVKLK